MVRTAWLLPLLVVGSGCAGRVDLGGERGDGGHVEAGPAEAAADAATVGAADAASAEPDAAAPTPDALAESAVPARDAAGDAAPTPDALAEFAVPARDAAGHCTDGKQDFDESDVDCGGSCAPCGVQQVCFVDTDCSPTASGCDVDAGGCYCVARALVCTYSHCLDQKKDVDETDLDCGGRSCSGCALGLPCRVDSDCASSACDALSHVCIGNPCADHHQDGMESDVDCGGGCNGCTSGRRCNGNFDCLPGHTCQGDAGARVCQ